jgi:hypothetical protein
MNPTGEQFGEARLLGALGRGCPKPLRKAVAALAGEIERWPGLGSPLDDLSLLAVEVSVASSRA